MSVHTLDSLGWNAGFQASLEAVTPPPHATALEPARVSQAHRDSLRVLTPYGELVADVTGRLHHIARSALDLPTVGDWVAIAARRSEGSATVHAVLDRRSVLARKAAGTRPDAQPLAANVDTVFVVTSCNQDIEPRRIERALVLVWDAGAEPVVVVNKTDLAPDAAVRVATLGSSLPGATVLGLSAGTGEGVSALDPHLQPGRTIALLGSSGVGKSTLTNRLLGEERMLVRDIREDDARGRHTTTARHLFALPGGALLIDTPGIREVGLWGDVSALGETFEDVDALAGLCRFGDCEHRSEPGCAVQAAIASGDLDPDRLASQRKLEREMRRLAVKQNRQAAWQERARFRALGKMYKEAQDTRRRLRHD